jgi:hypothetical protein
MGTALMSSLKSSPYITTSGAAIKLKNFTALTVTHTSFVLCVCIEKGYQRKPGDQSWVNSDSVEVVEGGGGAIHAEMLGVLLASNGLLKSDGKQKLSVVEV